MKTNVSLLILTFSILPLRALAGPVDIPNSFSAGTPAVAAEVNANFDAVEAAVDDNDGRIAELAAENADLTARVAELESLIEAIHRHMSFETDSQGHPAVVFSGVNVHVNNGEGRTSTVNGLGNLVVGYDELTQLTTEVCSDGLYDNETDCLNNGAVWQTSHKSGSHNVVIGPENNYSQYGGLVAGGRNTINGRFATVTGGLYNTAGGEGSSISGGYENTTVGEYSSISGGWLNTANGNMAGISGGYLNIADGLYSSIGGGQFNTTDGGYSHVSGGQYNSAEGEYSSVSGGYFNTASGESASVSGGFNNAASGTTSAIGGGRYNNATANGSSVWGGYGNTASGASSAIGGGFQNSATLEFEWVD